MQRESDENDIGHCQGEYSGPSDERPGCRERTPWVSGHFRSAPIVFMHKLPSGERTPPKRGQRTAISVPNRCLTFIQRTTQWTIPEQHCLNWCASVSRVEADHGTAIDVRHFGFKCFLVTRDFTVCVSLNPFWTFVYFRECTDLGWFVCKVELNSAFRIISSTGPITILVSFQRKHSVQRK